MSDYWLKIGVIAVALVAFVIAWRRGAFLRLSAYWNEMVEELKKCTWPTWEELQGSTIAVIISVVFLGAFTAIVDVVVTSVIKMIV